MTLRLLGEVHAPEEGYSAFCSREVHAPEEGLEAGVGAEGVNEPGLVDEGHQRVVFFGSGGLQRLARPEMPV